METQYRPPAEPSTAIKITRAIDGPERQFITTAMPLVNENIVVLARIQRGSLKNFSFLNVINDAGISEALLLNVAPANRVLTGTNIHVDSTVPANMPDFDSGTSDFYDISLDLITLNK